MSTEKSQGIPLTPRFFQTEIGQQHLQLLKSVCNLDTLRTIFDNMQLLGLRFASTLRQSRSGTISFFDPITSEWYALYKTGYARRGLVRYNSFGHYPVNPRPMLANGKIDHDNVRLAFPADYLNMALVAIKAINTRRYRYHQLMGSIIPM